jgi:hypothetical protein
MAETTALVWVLLGGCVVAIVAIVARAKVEVVRGHSPGKRAGEAAPGTMAGMSIPESDDDLEALLREHFARPEVAARLDADYWAAVEAHRRRAPEPPPASTVPMPDFPGFCVARYRCPRGCGWFHDESTDVGPSAMILPADPQEMDAMLSLNAEARALAYRQRVEAAIAAHYAEAH